MSCCVATGVSNMPEKHQRTEGKNFLMMQLIVKSPTWSYTDGLNGSIILPRDPDGASHVSEPHLGSRNRTTNPVARNG